MISKIACRLARPLLPQVEASCDSIFSVTAKSRPERAIYLSIFTEPLSLRLTRTLTVPGFPFPAWPPYKV
jgi:hypothetical protein